MIKQVQNIVVALPLALLIACTGGSSSNVKKENGGSASDPNVAIATGYATIYDNDKALARDRATDDAKNKLVRKVLGETVRGQSLMKDYELVYIIVEARSYGLVRNVEVLSQGARDGEYFVKIRGRVEEAEVERAIRDALERYGRPKFMVLIKENFEGKRSMPGFTETEMIIQEVMGGSGFEFVDPGVTRRLMQRNREAMNSAMAGNVKDDVQRLLLNQVGAEVLIVGTSSTADQSEILKQFGNVNMKSKQANVSLKAVDLYTGNILASMSRNAPGMHIDPATASRTAIRNTMKKMLGSVDSSTGKFEVGPFTQSIVRSFVRAATERQIQLVISGLDYNDLKEFRETISYRVRGVQKVIPRGQAGKAALVDVYFAGKTHDFIDELQAKSTNLGFRITIQENYPNRVVMTAERTGE